MKFRLKIISVFSVFFLVMSHCTIVHAADYITFNDHVLNGGVGNYGYNNRYYYITSSASNYAASIETAMSDWIYTTKRLGVTTPISYKRTYTQSSSVMDIYAEAMPGTETGLACTQFFKNGTQISAYKQNWGWNKIIINSNKCTTTNVGTIAHEMGHCFGLNDNNTNKKSIMCQTAGGRAVSQAQVCDLNGVNYLY